MLKIGVKEDIFIATSLLSLYAACGQVSNMEELFGEMQRKYKSLDAACWNAKLSGYP